MAFDLDAPSVFRVGQQPALGPPVMLLDYKPGILPPAVPLPETEGRLSRLERRLAFLEREVAILRQAVLDIEFPPPPPPWYTRLGRWLQSCWQSLSSRWSP